jgi:hypothetical protein
MCGRCQAMEAAFFGEYATEANFTASLNQAVRAGIAYDEANPEPAAPGHEMLPMDSPDGEIATNMALFGREKTLAAYAEQNQVQLQRQHDEMLEVAYKLIVGARETLVAYQGNKQKAMLSISGSSADAFATAGRSLAMVFIMNALLLTEIAANEGAFNSLMSERTSLDGIDL